MNALERVIDALKSHGCKPWKCGRGWMARCPGHDDVHASLSIGTGDDGKVLLRCHGGSGCPLDSILSPIGLSTRDLFEDAQARGNGHRKRQIVKTYDYTDETGRVLHRTNRYSPKGFSQCRPNGNAGWIPDLKGVRLVLYNLPNVIKARNEGKTITVTEGEKDADAVNAAGGVATCNPMGAGKWRKEFSEILRGANLIIIADKDGPEKKFEGQRHALDVFRSLEGSAASVQLAEAAQGKDASDHLAAGFTLDQFIPRTQVELEVLIPKEPKASSKKKTSESTLDLSSEFHPTDLWNARRLVDQHGHDLRHLAKSGKWLNYDGTRWAEDVTGEVMRRAKETVAQLYAEAAGQNEENRKALATHAVRSESAQKIAAMVNLAESEAGIAVRHEDFDKDVYLFNVQNGTLDLKTGELRPHRREDMITRLAPVAYDPTATCPTFHAILKKVLSGNDALISFFQRAIGYSLTAATIEQVLFVLYGTGANGKTTLLNAVSEMMGDYATSAAPEVLMANRKDSHPTAIADLEGRRLVAAMEVDEGSRLAENLVKKLTGGDPMKARKMRQDYWEFIPRFKLFLACNHKPVIRGTDLAIWRRIRLIPFTITIPSEEQDRSLPDKLRAELPGILRWAVEGCVAWRKEGLGLSPDVTEATESYRAEMDVVAAFLADQCALEGALMVTKKALYDAFKVWAEDSCDYVLSKKMFGSRLLERGFKDYSDGNDRFWIGLGLVARPDPGTDT